MRRVVRRVRGRDERGVGRQPGGRGMVVVQLVVVEGRHAVHAAHAAYAAAVHAALAAVHAAHAHRLQHVLL